MKISIKFKSFFLLLVTALAFTSCVDKEYDEIQTANVDPPLVPTHTIREFQALAIGPAFQITEDIIIAGVVVADDSSGNIYKKIILQQDSNGISINVDKSDYYTEYRVGRRLFIKCKGLYLANNDGNFELGSAPAGDPTGRIPWGMIGQYIVKGQWGQYLAPKVYNIDDANIPTNTLVQFNNVEFENQNVVWATDGFQNQDVVDCAGNALVVYSSTFSTFHLKPIPNGNGSIVGVYTIYNGAGELQVRDERDADMDGLRCNAYVSSLTNMPLDSIRLHDPGTSTYSLDTARKITVTITSDYLTKMIPDKNAYAQDGTAGIQLRFTKAHTFAKGQILQIDISGLELSNYNGQLQINNIPLARAIPGNIAQATPRTTTIADINANYTAWEGQLVKLDNVTINGTGTYQGNFGVNTITDALSNTIELYTGSTATFVNDLYPTGVVSITGILTEYNGTKEILIRNTNDVHP